MTTYTPISASPSFARRENVDRERTIPNYDPDISGLTRFLGWFSIGLGVCELLKPGAVSRIAGSNNHKGLVRLYGAREVAAGVGILTSQNPGNWLWARVAGDVVDMASIVKGSSNGAISTGALAAVAGVTALDIYCAQRASAVDKGAQQNERAEANLMINRSPRECYDFWRNYENFPRFVPQLRSVQATGEKTSRWAMSLPKGPGLVEWDAEITEDVPGQRISWQSLPGTGVKVNGSVTFEPAAGQRGTIIRVQMDYEFPGSSIAAPLARVLGMNPEQFAQKALHRFRQLLELGEIVETEGQSAGRRGSTTWLDAISRI